MHIQPSREVLIALTASYSGERFDDGGIRDYQGLVQEGGGLFLPAYENLWTDEVMAVDPNFATLREIMFNDTPYTGQAYPANPNAAIAAIDGQSITSQMMANVINGSMTVEEAVEDAHTKIVQIFEELGLPQS